MVHLIFITPAEERIEIDVPAEGSLMEAAKAHNVPGILADCGGAMACGTCHVMIPPEFHPRLPEQSDIEREMMEYVPEPQPHTRLTCQIPVTEELDGLVMHIPALQR